MVFRMVKRTNLPFQLNSSLCSQIQLTTVRNTAADDGKTITWRMNRNTAQVCKFKLADGSLRKETTYVY